GECFPFRSAGIRCLVRVQPDEEIRCVCHLLTAYVIDAMYGSIRRTTFGNNAISMACRWNGITNVGGMWYLVTASGHQGSHERPLPRNRIESGRTWTKGKTHFIRGLFVAVVLNLVGRLLVFLMINWYLSC